MKTEVPRLTWGIVLARITTDGEVVATYTYDDEEKVVAIVDLATMAHPTEDAVYVATGSIAPTSKFRIFKISP